MAERCHMQLSDYSYLETGELDPTLTQLAGIHAVLPCSVKRFMDEICFPTGSL